MLVHVVSRAKVEPSCRRRRLNADLWRSLGFCGHHLPGSILPQGASPSSANFLEFINQCPSGNPKLSYRFGAVPLALRESPYDSLFDCPGEKRGIIFGELRLSPPMVTRLENQLGCTEFPLGGLDGLHGLADTQLDLSAHFNSQRI